MSDYHRVCDSITYDLLNYGEYERCQKLKSLHWEHQVGRLSHLETIVRCIKEQSIPGDIVEFGVFEGFSLSWLARFRERHCLRDCKIIGIDACQGLPESTRHWKKGRCQCDFDKLQANIAAGLTPKQQENLLLINGWFADEQVRVKLFAACQETFKGL